MKVKVTKIYSDRFTHETIEVGRELEVSAERGKELIEAGVVEEVKPSKKANNGDEE